MARSLRLAAGALAPLAVLAVVVSATGGLYLLRPSLGFAGGRVADVLPLDELSHRAGVSVAAFLLVWAGAGLLLGYLARLARLDRLTAALGLSTAVWLWLYALTAASLRVIRQVPTGEALAAAHHVRAIYLAAGLAGLGGALLGRPPVGTSRRWPIFFGVLVAVAGLVDILSAVTPEIDERLKLLEAYAPHAVPPLASALVAAVGLALVVLGRGLGRRKRRAFELAVPLLAGSALLHLAKGLDYEEAIAAGLVGLSLVARRRDFDAPGDPDSAAPIAAKALIYATGIYVYGAVALLANRALADQPYTLGFALRETTRASLGVTLLGSQHVASSFGAWFPLSVFLAGAAALLSLLFEWLHPWRYRQQQEERERGLAHGLVATWGADTLAPFVLRADKSYFFAEDERAFLAYKVVGGVAIVSGDPIGPPEAFGDLLGCFIAFAHRRDWRIAILGASTRFLDLYEEHGLHSLYHGDEAVVDTASFSLEGRAIRKVRQSVHRLERAGYAAEVAYPPEIGPELRAELETIAREWRGSEPQRGFVMALDELFRLEAEEAVFVIGRGPDGSPMGFLHFAVSSAGSALSLSSMPRRRTTPNGFNEWLVCEAVAWARAHAFARVSLNFAPFAALFAAGAELSRGRRLERRVLCSLKGHFQLDNLLVFNEKFFPRWQERFFVYERKLDLPRAGIAALAAEAYLPFSGRRAA